MNNKKLSLFVGILSVAAIAWALFEHFGKASIHSIVTAPVVKTEQQKDYAQAYDQKANALFDSLNRRIDALEQQSKQAKEKGDTEAAEKESNEAKNLKKATEDYREQVDKYAKGTDQSPPQTPGPGGTAPPSNASVPEPPPVPQLPDSGADDQQQQAVLDVAALGACVIEPEVCPFAQALAGLFGSMDGETKRSLIKLLAGGRLGELNDQDMKVLLDAAAKNPKIRDALSSLEDTAKGKGDGIAKQVQGFQQFIDQQVHQSDVVTKLQTLVESHSSCEVLKSNLPNHKFASLDEKALVGALTLRLGQTGADAWKCLQDVEVQ